MGINIVILTKQTQKGYSIQVSATHIKEEALPPERIHRKNHLGSFLIQHKFMRVFHYSQRVD